MIRIISVMQRRTGNPRSSLNTIMPSKRSSDIHSAFSRESSIPTVAKPRGKPVAISDQNLETALDRLANGDTM